MKIGIVGLGLIGGSLGLDLTAQGHQVVGVSRKAQTCQRAIARQAVMDASPDPAILGQCQVVFLCPPLGVMESTLRAIIPYLQPATVVTDVGSVKDWVVQTLSPLWPNFVGGHPMAGTAESGIEAAQPELFVGAAYVLTPTDTTPATAVLTVEQLIQPLGVRIYHCQPQEHDLAVAWISHLPVFASASLIAACQAEADGAVLHLAQALASSGFRDTSRVGGGNPELGLMMARYNRPALLRSLYAYRETLDQFIRQIEQQEWSALESHLQQTQKARPAFVKE
jgi:arogenate dehydrogenase (NADP+)